MAKDAHVNLLLWCARERESLNQQLEALKAGRLQILEMDEAGLRDISGRTIARLTANVAELDKVLAEYDAFRDRQAWCRWPVRIGAPLVSRQWIALVANRSDS